MKLPERDDWMRIGYTCLGGGTAYLWNRYLKLNAKGGGYIPPAALATIILMSENTGATEKDIAAGILGYTSVAQAISFVQNKDVDGDDSPEEATTALENPSGSDQAAQKLAKIRAVTGTLGALADIVGRFKGNS